MIHRFLFAAALLVLGGSSGVDLGLAPHAGPLGPSAPCYEIVLDGWSPPPPATPDSLVLALPGRVRLDEEDDEDEAPAGERPPDVLITDPLAPAGAGWSPPRRIRTAEGALESVHEERTWQEGPDGTLLLRFVTRGSGVLVRVDRAGEAGRAAAFWNVPLPVHRASARLHGVDCDAPLDPDAAFRWDFPVAVPLGGGDVASAVELGALVSPELRSAPGAGFLEGAAEITLHTTDAGRRLEGVVADFPPEVEHGELLERLEAAWGPPSVAYGTTFRWIGRSLLYTMFAPSAEGWRVEMQVRPGHGPISGDRRDGGSGAGSSR